jgi:hypothetical protein
MPGYSQHGILIESNKQLGSHSNLNATLSAFLHVCTDIGSNMAQDPEGAISHLSLRD